MKTILRISFVIVLLCLFVLPVQAQEERVYENESIWQIGYVEVKEGHLNDYMKYLSQGWKMSMDEYVKDGKILSYKILDVTWARDNEPNLIILIEAKNWAVLDTWHEYRDKVKKKVKKLLEKKEIEDIDIDEISTNRGELISWELKFKE